MMHVLLLMTGSTLTANDTLVCNGGRDRYEALRAQ